MGFAFDTPHNPTVYCSNQTLIHGGQVKIEQLKQVGMMHTDIL